jgi:hypothetical protein
MERRVAVGEWRFCSCSARRGGESVGPLGGGGVSVFSLRTVRGRRRRGGVLNCFAMGSLRRRRIIGREVG